MSKIETKNWYAIVDRKSVPPVLLVAGIVNAPDKMLAFLAKKIPQGINPKILMLDLFIVNGFVPVDNPQSVAYSERVEQEFRYETVEIFYDGELIETIKEIKEYGLVLTNGN